MAMQYSGLRWTLWVTVLAAGFMCQGVIYLLLRSWPCCPWSQCIILMVGATVYHFHINTGHRREDAGVHRVRYDMQQLMTRCFLASDACNQLNLTKLWPHKIRSDAQGRFPIPITNCQAGLQPEFTAGTTQTEGGKVTRGRTFLL